jgi:hypothetical protein
MDVGSTLFCLWSGISVNFKETQSHLLHDKCIAIFVCTRACHPIMMMKIFSSLEATVSAYDFLLIHFLVAIACQEHQNSNVVIISSRSKKSSFPIQLLVGWLHFHSKNYTYPKVPCVMYKV